MKMRLAIATAIAWAVALNGLPAQSHGGGLNSQGCHNQTSTGSCHCHGSPKSKEPKRKKPKKEKNPKSGNKQNKNKKNKPAKFSQSNPGESTSSAGGKPSRATIRDCYDGDTCTTTSGEKIRLACIDAPEIGSGSGAIAARNRVTALVVGKEVTIRRYEQDRYGRTVAEIFTPGGQSSSQDLVNGGYAEVYTQYANNCAWAR